MSVAGPERLNTIVEASKRRGDGWHVARETLLQDSTETTHTRIALQHTLPRRTLNVCYRRKKKMKSLS